MRLRIKHFRGMKILPDKTRTHVLCINCPDVSLMSRHIFECPALAPHVLKLGMVPLNDHLRVVLYNYETLELAAAIVKTFNII